MKKNKVQILCFDWKEFSDTAFEELKGLSSLGLYVYDIEAEIYGQAMSDTWIIVISQKRLTRKELLKIGKDCGMMLDGEE